MPRARSTSSVWNDALRTVAPSFFRLPAFRRAGPARSAAVPTTPTVTECPDLAYGTRLPPRRGRSLSSDVLAPAAPQRVRGGLGLPVAGEDALLVAADAHDAGGGGEVREVPHLLADDRVDPVEHAVVHVEVRDLVLLAPRLRGDRVQAGVGVGAVLGD